MGVTFNMRMFEWSIPTAKRPSLFWSIGSVCCGMFVLTSQSGEGAPVSRKGTCANHVRDVAKFLHVSPSVCV